MFVSCGSAALGPPRFKRLSGFQEFYPSEESVFLTPKVGIDRGDHGGHGEPAKRPSQCHLCPVNDYLNFVDYRVMSVCSHKRKHARLICLCTGLVLALWLFLGWLAEPPLRCVRGLAPDPTMYYAEVYRLAASFEQLHRSTALELSNKGFVQEWSHQSPGGRSVGYQKGDSAEEVYLIERAAATGNVEIWFKKDGRPPRLREYLGLLKGRMINRSAFNSCIATLKQIEGAKANWAMEGGKSTNDTPRDADLFGPQAYIRNAPVCPAGGIYTIGTVAEPPRCTFTNHYLP